jgi:hypothetical protein
MIPVSARRVVMFHPSHILKALVHEHRPVLQRAAEGERVVTTEAVQPEEFSVQS